jgi:DNA invertase Pin-like site-specific DNA recombinase
MDALYFRVSANCGTQKNQMEDLVRVAEQGGFGRHDPPILELLSQVMTSEQLPGSRPRCLEGAPVPSYVDRLADLQVYVDPDECGSRPTIQRLKRDAAMGKFKRLLVRSVPSLGRDIREVVATVHDLTSQGVTIVPMRSDAEPVGPELTGALREVLTWCRELDHHRRSAAIKAGQTKVRAKGKRVGRPRRIFDREVVVRLRDEEGLSWSKIAQALGIGAGTARRAYQQTAASPGPAKNMREVA